MTPDERKSLAQQITTNPLFIEIMDGIEQNSIERLIYADEDTRLEAQLRVKAIRTLRADLDECLNTRTSKAAPA